MTILTPPASEDTDLYLDAESRRALRNRLARIEGHVRAVSRMVDERACADEILLQVAAVKGALSRFSSILVEEELESCVATCMTGQGDDVEERVARLTKVIATMLGNG